MRTIFTVLAIVCLSATAGAQVDSTEDRYDKDSTFDATAEPYDHDTTITPQNDTLRVGGMIIIRDGRDRDDTYFDERQKRFRHRKRGNSTYWFAVDLGFSQLIDNTNYPQAIANGYLPAGATGDWFDQRNFKSTNVNIWVFMQRLNLIKNVVNLKYGAGLELNNYKFREDIKFQTGKLPLVVMADEDYRKNKLAADYLTVPLMLNFNFTPRGKSNGIGFSVGASAGYLYSSRQKINSNDGKNKFRDDYDLRDFKISYIGEITMGPVILYGSYATRSMFESTLDQTPINFGIRLSSL